MLSIAARLLLLPVTWRARLAWLARRTRFAGAPALLLTLAAIGSAFAGRLRRTLTARLVAFLVAAGTARTPAALTAFRAFAALGTLARHSLQFGFGDFGSRPLEPPENLADDGSFRLSHRGGGRRLRRVIDDRRRLRWRNAFDGGFRTRSDRLLMLQRCMRLAMEDLSLVPLAERDLIYGVREDLMWEVRADGRLLARDLRRLP